MLLAQVVSLASLLGVCDVYGWLFFQDRCAAQADMTQQLEMFRREVILDSVRLKIETPVSVWLVVNAQPGANLAWSSRSISRYHVTANVAWLLTASPASIRSTAAHEVCHVARGDVDALAVIPELAIDLNNPASTWHLRVDHCIMGILGEAIFCEAMSSDSGWDAAQCKERIDAVRELMKRDPLTTPIILKPRHLQ